MKNPFSSNGHDKEEGQFEKLIQRMKLKSKKESESRRVSLLIYAIVSGLVIIGYLLAR
jgi:hypothetical protein